MMKHDTEGRCPVCKSTVVVVISTQRNYDLPLFIPGSHNSSFLSITSISCGNTECRLKFEEVPGIPGEAGRILAAAKKKLLESQDPWRHRDNPVIAKLIADMSAEGKLGTINSQDVTGKST